jgi:hypothetical protein
MLDCIDDMSSAPISSKMKNSRQWVVWFFPDSSHNGIRKNRVCVFFTQKLIFQPICFYPKHLDKPINSLKKPKKLHKTLRST